MTEETTTAVAEAPELDVDLIRRMAALLPSAHQPRLTTWATPDARRLMAALTKDQRMVADPKVAPLDKAYLGIPVIEDKSLPAHIMAEARDQYGEPMESVNWS